MFIFVSYARADEEFALRLDRKLRASGFETWIDQTGIRAGHDWAKTIENSLRAADLVLTVLSPNAAESTEMRNEIAFAIDEDTPVIPLVAKESCIPLRLRGVQAIDFSNGFEVGMKKLLTDLAQFAPRKKHSPNSTRFSTKQEEQPSTEAASEVDLLDFFQITRQELTHIVGSQPSLRGPLMAHIEG